MKFIIKLIDLKKDSVGIGGGKASNLGELMRGGFPVPDGFCVNSEGFRFYIRHNHLENAITQIAEAAKNENREALHTQIAKLKASIVNGRYPDELRNEILEAFADISDEKRLAIRSSATAEDLKDASFAGQQETYLGVKGKENLLQAIQKCFASLYEERAVIYRERMGYHTADAALAVVVQEMIDSETAGVIFTENPVNQNADEMMINASYGLGESVVSGKVTPDIYICGKENAEIRSKTAGTKETAIYMNSSGGTDTVNVPDEKKQEFALTNAQITELVRVSEQIERQYHMPMDIEWAFEGGKLYILQARAITTIHEKDGFKKETETERAFHQRTFIGPKELKREMYVRMQMNNLIEHCPITPYPLDFGPFMTVMNAKQVIFAEHGIVQDDVLLMNEDGLIRENVKKPKYKVSVVKLPFQMKGFLNYAVNYPAAEKSIEEAKAAISKIDPHTIPSHSIQKTIAEILEIARQISYHRFRYAIFPYVCQAKFMKKSLHKVDPGLSNYDLMCNLSYKTWDMNQALGKLADMIRKSAVLKDIFDEACRNQSYEEGIKKLSSTSPAFADAMDAFLREFGWKSDHSYVAFSTTSWNENKASLFSLLGVLARSKSSLETDQGRYQTIMSDIDAKLSAREAAKLKERIVQNRAYHVLREESLYQLETCYGYCRILLDRLLDGDFKDVISREDVLYLTVSELCNSDREQIRAFLEKIRVRKANRKINMRLWEGLEVSRDNHDVTVLKGVSGNRGRVTGKARIINGIHEFGKLKEGEILVCRYTDPEWTPLFSIAAAVVSDTGGPLSHSAIVAREFGIPAVLATGEATRRLKNGSWIDVDGDEGIVHVLS